MPLTEVFARDRLGAGTSRKNLARSFAVSRDDLATDATFLLVDALNAMEQRLTRSFLALLKVVSSCGS
ncbi:hypothetical protein AB0M95_32080 [Sphaerisporangium sp. NPDC051017]|uniref:hypothetical protein n=1 Tax=Sphaerisporangium sp. NPDC051017 TaxID=3154636 RepID=UPI00343163DE